MDSEQSAPLVSEDQDLYYKGGPFDREDPKSLINIMPRECLKTLENVRVDYIFMGELELQKIVNPSPRLNQIRFSFWKEYDRARSELTRMSVDGMIKFLDGLPTFHVQRSLEDPKQFAWILHVPTSYDNMLEEALARGLGRINEILSMPFKTDGGTTDYRVMELVLKATAFLDVRKHGMPEQKLSSTSNHTTRRLNMNIGAGDLKKMGMPSIVGIEDIDQKIKRLEQELKKPQVIDVDP